MTADHSELDAEAIITALVRGAVDFIVIGGFAVIAHGYLRATRDIDICPAPEADNLSRLSAVLAELEAEIAGLEEFDPEELPGLDPEGLALGGNFILRTKHGRLDVLQLVSPDLEFADLAKGAIDDEAFGLPVRICGYSDLVRMKEASGRPRDAADLAELREVRGENE